jgi:hypothetical protein
MESGKAIVFQNSYSMLIKEIAGKAKQGLLGDSPCF